MGNGKEVRIFREGEQMTDLSGESVIVFDLRGEITYWNTAASELYRFESSDALGCNVVRLLDCSSTLLGRRPQEMASDTGSWCGIVQRKTADRSPIDVSLRWVLQIGKSGEPEAVIEFGKALETEDSVAQLKVRDERFRALFHRLPVALMLADAQGIGRILRGWLQMGITDLGAYLDQNPAILRSAMKGALIAAANTKALSTLGATECDELHASAEHMWSVSPQTFKRSLIARFEGNFQFSEETRILTIDGRVIDAMFTIAFPPPEDGMGLSLLCITDITGIKATEQRLKTMQAEFAETTRAAMLGELVTSIAHEMNQPLAAIALNSAAASKWLSSSGSNPDKALERIHKIAADASRASEMLRQMKSITGRRQPKCVELNLNDVISELLLFFSTETRNQAVSVTTKLAVSNPLVLADKALVQQVIMNLLTNSLEAFDGRPWNGRHIHIETWENETSGEVSLNIKDNACGILPEDLNRVFNGFFTTKPESLGMGLSICHSIIAAYGGRIAFDSGIETGASVSLVLPSARGGPSYLLGDIDEDRRLDYHVSRLENMDNSI